MQSRSRRKEKLLTAREEGCEKCHSERGKNYLALLVPSLFPTGKGKTGGVEGQKKEAERKKKFKNVTEKGKGKTCLPQAKKKRRKVQPKKSGL